MDGKVAFISAPEYLEHHTGLGHPESPQRLAAIWEKLHDEGLWDKLVHVEPKAASVDDLLTVHSAEYVEQVRRDIEAGRSVLSTGDTSVCPKSYEIALLAAGGVMCAVDAVCEGNVDSAFCAVRPPGHHATASAGMGFCIFNNVAVAARHAQKNHGVGRILIVDWDFHHGNGTQEIFYDDPSVFYFSTHQFDRYPMALTGLGYAGQTGSGKGKGANINCPLELGVGDKEIIAAFTEDLVLAMEAFPPELVIISAGFDCIAGDPIGELNVTDDGIAELTGILMDIAAASAGGRIVSVLEGGYDLAGLASATARHIRTMMD
ncbi:MAG: histone deacetylase [Planctomycetota bacterium]|nr:histone deacetylase [Planctomycetota bacterium]